MFVIFTFVLLIILYPNSAQAYLDPGSFSYLLHLIVAAIAGFFVTIKLYSIKIKNFFFKIFKINKKKK
tara:strand:- start:174 stop:377 length:204 start_codon:yes stop_codon:yes gene_type:complete